MDQLTHAVAGAEAPVAQHLPCGGREHVCEAQAACPAAIVCPPRRCWALGPRCTSLPRGACLPSLPRGSQEQEADQRSPPASWRRGRGTLKSLPERSAYPNPRCPCGSVRSWPPRACTPGGTAEEGGAQAHSPWRQEARGDILHTSCPAREDARARPAGRHASPPMCSQWLRKQEME